MHINSIFLSKATPTQVSSDDKSVEGQNFNYLFTNIIKVLHPDKSESGKVQITNILNNANHSTNLNPLLLTVSLFSNSNIPDTDESIGNMFANLLGLNNSNKKLVKSENSTEEISAEYKTPKYLSLSSETLLTEIKKLIDELSPLINSGSSISEIRLITPDTVLEFKSDLSGLSEFEKIITDQLKSDLGFGLIIKSGNKEIALEVQPGSPVISSSVQPPVEKSETIEGTNSKLSSVTNVKNPFNTVTVFESHTTESSESISTPTANSKPEAKVTQTFQQQNSLYDAQKPQLDFSEEEKGIKINSDKNNFLHSGKNIYQAIQDSLTENIVEQFSHQNKSVNNSVENNLNKSINYKEFQETNTLTNNAVEKSAASEIRSKYSLPTPQVNYVQKSKLEKLNSISGKVDSNKITARVHENISTINKPRTEYTDDIKLFSAEDRKVLEVLSKKANLVEFAFHTSKKTKPESKTTTLNLNNAETLKLNKNGFRSNISSPEVALSSKNGVKAAAEIKSKLSNTVKLIENEKLADVAITSKVETKTDSENVKSTSETNSSRQTTFHKTPATDKKYITIANSKTSDIVSESTLNNKHELTTESKIKPAFPVISEYENLEPTNKTETKYKLDKTVKDASYNLPQKSIQIDTLKTDSLSTHEQKKIVTAEKKSTGFEESKVSKHKDADQKAHGESALHFTSKHFQLSDFEPKKLDNSNSNTNLGAKQSADNLSNKPTEVNKPGDTLNYTSEQSAKSRALESSDNQSIEHEAISQSASEKPKVTVSTDKKEFQNNRVLEEIPKHEDTIVSKTNPAAADNNSSSDSSTGDDLKNSLDEKQPNTNDISKEIKIEQKTLTETIRQTSPQLDKNNYDVKSEKVRTFQPQEVLKEVHRIIESSERQTAILKLVPKELGTVKIVLDTIDNSLTARIEVENETVGLVVRNNIEQLKHSLAQSGVNLGSISIALANSDHKQSNNSNSRRKSNSALYAKNIDKAEEKQSTRNLGYNTYEYLA